MTRCAALRSSPNGWHVPRRQHGQLQCCRRLSSAYHRSMASTSASGLHALVEERRDAIKDAARRHRGVSISLFGSLARGTDNESSDADFLVEFESGSSLFDLLHLQDELRELLGRPVDVVSVAGLKARDDRIRREAITL